MKIFISQPMRGKTDEEIKTERERVIDRLMKMFPDGTIDVIDSFFEGAPVDAKPLWFLGKSIEKLSTADIAVFVEGYEEARGCMIERECTSLYNIPSYVAFNNGLISRIDSLNII